MTPARARRPIDRVWSALVRSCQSLVAAILAASCSSGGDGAAGDPAEADAGGGAGEPSIDAAPAAIPCPDGLGDHWECADSARVRCIDEVLQQEACASGCVPAAGAAEAVCSCGGQTELIRWNCLDDGDIHACRAGGWLTESCGGRGCEVRPPGTSDVCLIPDGRLQEVVTRLGGECSELSPGTTCGLAVRDLVTGESASYRGTVAYEAASTVKSVWVALALYDVGAAAVEPYADPVFADSDNVASGRVIDLLSSPDRINTFMWHDVRMPDSGFCRWNTEHARESALCEDLANGANYLAADDAIRFLAGVWDRSLIGAGRSQQLRDWMLLSPRTGTGGWLGAQLPPDARAAMYHKAGWYPPYTSHEIGVVEVPGGHAYAVALLLGRSDGSSGAYNGTQLPMLEYASCVVYHAVADDGADPFALCSPP